MGHKTVSKMSVYRWSHVPEVIAAVRAENDRRRAALVDAPLRYSRRMWDFFADVATGAARIENEEQAAALSVFLGLDGARPARKFGGSRREPVGDVLPVPEVAPGSIPAGATIMLNVNGVAAPQIPAIDYGREGASLAPRGEVEVLDE